MKIVQRISDGVVVATGTDVRLVEEGIYCDNTIYIEDDLSIVETDKEVVAFKNTLINDVVGINHEYTRREEERANSPEKKIIKLEAEMIIIREQNALMQQAIDELILGGLI